MATFIAIYRGETISSAKLITVSADPRLVSDIAARLLKRRTAHSENEEEQDDVLAIIERGQRTALRVIRREAEEASSAAS